MSDEPKAKSKHASMKEKPDKSIEHKEHVSQKVDAKDVKKADHDESKSKTSDGTNRSKTRRHTTLHVHDVGNEPQSFEGIIDPDEPLPATNFVSWRLDRPVALRTTKTGPLAQKPITMMTVLRDSVNRHPEKVAYASMVDGKWVKISYKELLDQVVHASLGFIKLGLQRFHCVGILGQNAIEFVIAHFGIIFAGGVSVPLTINTSDKFAYDLVKTAKCRMMVIDSIKDRKQVLEWRKKLPHFKSIIQYGHDVFDKSDTFDDLHIWKTFLEIGNDVPADVVLTRTMQQAPNLCCCVMQTAGCTGIPKNVMLSHDNLAWGANTIGRYLTLSDGNGTMVNFLPLGSIFGLTVGINIAVRFGATVYLIPMTRNKALLLRVLQEIRPTIFFGPTVFYEYIHRELIVKMDNCNFLKRTLSRWAMRIGRKAFDDRTRLKISDVSKKALFILFRRWADEETSKKIKRGNIKTVLGNWTNPPACWSLGNSLLFRNVRRALGVDACSEMIAAGGFMLRSDIDFFLSLNMPLLMAYGSTESSGSHTCCLLDRFRIDSVGVGMDGCNTQIANPDANGVGELLIGGRNLAMGYLDSEALTKKYFMADGSFRTGDLARKDAEGFIYIVDTESEAVTLSGGERVSTIPLNKAVMKGLPFVNHVVIVGDGKPYLSMMMTIKTDIDEKTELPSDRLTKMDVSWFHKLGYEVELVQDIVSKANPTLLDKIQMIVDRINAESQHESHKIKRWTFLSNDFTTQSDELSPTLKIRRWIVLKKYAFTIASMYQ